MICDFSTREFSTRIKNINVRCARVHSNRVKSLATKDKPLEKSREKDI